MKNTTWQPTALIAAAVLIVLPALVWPGAAAAEHLSLSDVGARVCAPHGPECRDRWNARVEAGDALAELAAAACLRLRYERHELDGILCLETVIRAAPFLPAGMLASPAFASPANAHDARRQPRPDRQWADTVAIYLAGIPAYCDQTTPVIYDYFDCLLRELQTAEFALQHRRL